MRHRRGGLSSLLALFTVALGAVGAVGADDARGGEFGILVGFTVPDEHVTGLEDGELSFGLRGGAVFSRHWGWFIDALYSDRDAVTLFDDATVISGRTGFDLLFTPERDARFFLSFGGGLTDVDYGRGAPDFDYPFASLGFGQRLSSGGRNHVRWEIRGDASLDDEGPANEKINEYHALVAFVWGPGGKPVDTDGDGVIDRRDDCPDTPRGAHVDARGCPIDSDGDGVPDGIDQCSGTPAGWPVDAKGCPKDSDGDGVFDGKDDCPGTPRGAVVDEKGCPKDGDGDGVPDGIDACPKTPAGAVVDAKGCPKDGDGDGVPDGVDACPKTPAGAVVDAKGCPKDSDGDGVPDGVDQCPGTPQGTKVDARGCAAKLFQEEQRSLVLEGVNFEFNEAVLTINSRTILDRVAASLRDWPKVRVEVGGHTDSKGSDSYNRKLSERRAKAVMDYLVARGVDASRLTAKGYGESKPIADNGTEAGRARNRRVELQRMN